MDEQNQQSEKQQNEQTKYSGWAIGGFIIGLFSIPILSPVATTGAIPVLAIILSWLGLNQIKKKGLRGKQLAIAGIIMAAIGLLYTITILLII